MELRGYIKEAPSVSINCCNSVRDIFINDKSLYNILDNEYDLDPEKDFKGEEQIQKLFGISYLILDEDPGDSDYQSIVGEFIVKKIYSEYVSGCYSEYTCGYGGYDFFIDGGHNLFEELSSHIGKYILLNIDDERTITINSILN